MLLNEGKVYCDNAKGAALVAGGAVWGLYTSAATPTAGMSLTTLLSAGHEATWAGYARQTCGAWAAAAIVSGKAVSTGTAPVFSNTDSVSHTFRGWFLYEPTAGKVIAAADFAADVTILAGGSYALVPTLTDDQA